MFRICSGFSVMFRLYSEYLAQKLLCSESLDFVVIYIVERSPDNEVHSTTRRTSKPKPENTKQCPTNHYITSVSCMISVVLHPTTVVYFTNKPGMSDVV